MAFEQPAPDLQKIITALGAVETRRGDARPVLASLKTAGLALVLAPARREGWTPSVPATLTART